MKTGGGFNAIWYVLRASHIVGFRKMIRAIHSKNTCKTCALGMGGQSGGMSDERGNFPEICKKSFQSQITDIQHPIPKKLFQEQSIEDFKKTPSSLLERSGRLNTPLYKAEGDSHYHPVSWENAIERIVSRLKMIAPQRCFFYSSGRSSNEAAFLLQLFARMYGCNNINNSSYYCHQASSVGMSATIGTGTATILLEDLEKSDLIFVIGANPASNHPRFIRKLLNCRRRGGQVIVINPAKENGLVRFAVPSDIKSMSAGGSSIASEYIQIKIGGDIALLKGIAKSIIETDKHNQTFIQDHTIGGEEYITDIKATPWETIVSTAGISKEEIRRIANIYGNSEHVIFSWGVGITHHIHGVENVESIVNLALLRGMIGKQYAGLLPLRGHSNVQGIGSVGFTPSLKEIVARNIESEFGVLLPKYTGMDTMSCMKASFNRDIDVAFIMGGNLYSANPDTRFTEEALDRIPFKVFLTTTLNHGHFYGGGKEVIILPVAVRDEEKQKTTQESMFNLVRMSNGAINRLNNVRSETDIIGEIANNVLGKKPIDFLMLKKHQAIRKLISQIIPGFENIAELDETRSDLQISNRTIHHAHFDTPGNKARFCICTMPAMQGKKGEFVMMTTRSEGQFNSTIFDERDLYRQQKNRWIVLMNKNDIQINGWQENALVTIESAVGKMEKVTVREFDIPSGNVMAYYPEANILVPTSTDPRSLTPGFKSVWVRISDS